MKFYATKISENIAETPEGFLLCLGVLIARTGEMEYGKGETPLEVGKNGKVVITRSEKEVFSEATIASFQGKPVTILHPEEFVDPSNWKELATGHMQNIRRGEGDEKDSLIADVLITDALAISLVKNGVREVSCGYEAEYIETGEGRGEQINIRGNHLALVEKGRAGPAYAIKDHKGVFKMGKKLADRIKGILSKAVDEATESEADPKEGAKDAAGAYDELVKMCKDLGAKIEGMKPKDEAPPKAEEKPAKEGKDEEVAPALEDRIKALETAVNKILEGMSAKAGDDDEDEDDVVDASKEEEAEDADEEEEPAATGDTASRAEILSPGIKLTKDVKVLALKAAYQTKEGKKVIDTLTSGKPTFDSAEKVDTLFVAASELMKAERGTTLAFAKTPKKKDIDRVNDEYQSHIFTGENVMTAEKMNEMNAKRYGTK